MSDGYFLLYHPRRRAYLYSDFETWIYDAKRAHRFIKGAALNACFERWRRAGVRVVRAES